MFTLHISYNSPGDPFLYTVLNISLLFFHLDIPTELRLQVMQLAILLMPDENRNVLQTLLLFLNEVAYIHISNVREDVLRSCVLSPEQSTRNTLRKIRGAATAFCRMELHDTLVSSGQSLVFD